MSIILGSNLMLTSEWAESFERTAAELKNSKDVLERVRSLEKVFRKWLIGLLLFILWGIGLMMSSRHMNMALTGLFMALTGLITSVLIKLAVQMRLSFLWLLWQQYKREEDELRRSIAEDL